MKFYSKKSVEAITFDELVQYGIISGANIIGSMPWLFIYNGRHVSHENDQCYIISTHAGSLKFTTTDILISHGIGLLEVQTLAQFYEDYRESKPSDQVPYSVMIKALGLPDNMLFNESAESVIANLISKGDYLDSPWIDTSIMSTARLYSNGGIPEFYVPVLTGNEILKFARTIALASVSVNAGIQDKNK